ncbi:hypothetical protein [Bauldia litoralis]|uniref:hypothetical protein n=1 Tax=Bauldia litoralis TaxID=665467 RepID=UPI003266D140
MCNACGFLCCAYDGFARCGCDHCDEPLCWSCDDPDDDDEDYDFEDFVPDIPPSKGEK